MGILPDDSIEPKLYYLGTANSSNQTVFRYNYLHTIIRHQQVINQTLTHSVQSVQEMLTATNFSQIEQYEHIVRQLQLQIAFSEQVANSIEQLTGRISKNQETTTSLSEELAKHEQLQEKILQIVKDQQTLHEVVLYKVNAQHEQYEHLLTKIHNQQDLYELIINKINDQEINHKEIMEKFDSQEGLMNKLVSVVEHLRSVIYERTTFIIDSFETSIKSVAKPIQGYITSRSKEKIDQKDVQ